VIAAITIGIAAAAAWYVLAPLRRATHGARSAFPEQSLERARLIRERDAAVRVLRDLVLDHATGKMSDGDYAVLRAQYEATAIGALRALDALGEDRAASNAPRPGAPSAPVEA
jgi:hypothetical protein